jgi:hypothetical protein
MSLVMLTQTRRSSTPARQLLCVPASLAERPAPQYLNCKPLPMSRTISTWRTPHALSAAPRQPFCSRRAMSARPRSARVRQARSGSKTARLAVHRQPCARRQVVSAPPTGNIHLPARVWTSASFTTAAALPRLGNRKTVTLALTGIPRSLRAGVGLLARRLGTLQPSRAARRSAQWGLDNRTATRTQLPVFYRRARQNLHRLALFVLMGSGTARSSRRLCVCRKSFAWCNQRILDLKTGTHVRVLSEFEPASGLTMLWFGPSMNKFQKPCGVEPPRSEAGVGKPGIHASQPFAATLAKVSNLSRADSRCGYQASDFIR